MIRKLITFIFLIIFGIISGVFLIDLAGQHLDLSRGMADFILVSYILFFVWLGIFLGRRKPVVTDSSAEAPIVEKRKKNGKSYAWLNPRGEETRSGFPVSRNLMIIGRDVHVDILINDISVSKKHAQIQSASGGFILKDLESRNGTFINSQRIKEAYLKDGDAVTFGEANFIFSCADVKNPILEIASELGADGETGTGIHGIDTAVGTGTGTSPGTASRIKGTGSRRSKSRLRDLSSLDTYAPDRKSSNEKPDSQKGE